MNILVIGLGAAGNKCVYSAIENGVIKENDVLLINSTSKDFPSDYKGNKLIISPTNTGCGKERDVSKAYVVNAIKSKVFDSIPGLANYGTIILVSSVEGGTGSGCVPMLAQYFAKVLVKNVHIFALAGFGEDVRGLANTIEFFKELDNNIITHTIDNKAFLPEAGGNKTKAEELANGEFSKRYKVLSGDILIPGEQNIDDTDIIKLSNTYGYSTVEYRELDKPIGDSSDYDKIIKRMIYESKSIKSEVPSSSKIGIILNLSESSREGLSDIFAILKENFGMPYECFKHYQYDGKKEYIAFIVAGMKLPIEELSKIYNAYIEQSKLINKNEDTFFSTMQSMTLLDEDKKFDMIKPVKKGISTDEFLSKI